MWWVVISLLDSEWGKSLCFALPSRGSREWRVGLETGMGGVIVGVGTHQVSCVALELLF